MKKLKIKIKGWLVVKIAELRKDNRHLRNKIEELILNERKYIDEMNNLKRKIRTLNIENARLKKQCEK